MKYTETLGFQGGYCNYRRKCDETSNLSLILQEWVMKEYIGDEIIICRDSTATTTGGETSQ